MAINLKKPYRDSRVKPKGQPLPEVECLTDCNGEPFDEYIPHPSETLFKIPVTVMSESGCKVENSHLTIIDFDNGKASHISLFRVDRTLNGLSEISINKDEFIKVIEFLLNKPERLAKKEPCKTMFFCYCPKCGIHSMESQAVEITSGKNAEDTFKIFFGGQHSCYKCRTPLKVNETRTRYYD